jgi:hypothetical protein
MSSKGNPVSEDSVKALFQTLKAVIENSPLASVLLMIGVLCLTSFWWMSALPAAASMRQVASPKEFSSERSFAYLTKIASQSHPLGTAAHDAVRSYLMNQLSALGLDPQTQHATFLQERRNDYLAADLDNILVRIQGSNNSKGVLLVAHYDSAITSPGAGDDGAGVATLVETARVLHQGPRLRNDVIFLLSDGEEQGSLGAKVFLRDHPWAKNVGAVLNFEARGTAGPSLMFETGANSDWLVKEFIATARYPYANSLMPGVYKLLPNDTDFTDFKKAGLPGLNFAFADGATDYHSALDSLGRVSISSLEHHGSYALSMARYLGDADLNHVFARGEEIYFNILGRHVVAYSMTTAWILTTMAIAACICVLVAMYRRKLVTTRNLALAALVVISAIFLTALVAYGVITFLTSTSQNLRAVFDNRLYRFALTAIGLAMASACMLFTFKRGKFGNLQAAALLIWTICVLLTMLYCPGASYVILWPLLAALVATAAEVITKTEYSLAKRYLLLLVLTVPVCILLVSTLELMYVAFFAEAAYIPAAFTALFLAIVLPQWKPLLDRKWWALPASFGAIGIILLAILAVPKKYNPNQPRTNNMLYMEDIDKNKAMWASLDSAPDSWTSQFVTPRAPVIQLSDFSTWYFRPRRVKSEPAAMSDIAPVTVNVVKDTKDQNSRTLSLFLQPHANTPLVALRIESKAKITGVSFEKNDPAQQGASAMTASRSQITQYPDNEFRLRYLALPAQGAVLTIQTGSTEPVAMSLISEFYGLPLLPGKAITPRGDDTIQRPGFGDRTIVLRSYSF